MVSDRSRRSSKRDRIFLSIADRSRRRILELLAGKELPAGRIAEQFTMSRPAVIKHLRILRSADLISVRRQGRERIHALNPAPLKSVQRWLAKFEAYWDEKLENLKKDVEEEARR